MISIDTKKLWLVAASLVCIISLFLAGSSTGVAMQDPEKKNHVAHAKAYQLFQNKCLACHVSVADPEKPPRTRDDWHLVVNVMHGYGLDLKLEESEAITDLLFDLRKKPADFY